MNHSTMGLQGLIIGVLLTELVQASGDVAVFDIGGDLDPLVYSVMMTVVIFGLALFDLALEFLEEYLHHHKGRFHKRLFHKALKELMILGTISFVLFILKDQSVYDQSDDTFTNTFDFVNLFLFFVGISLVLAAIMLVMATAPLKSRWDTYANAPLETLLKFHADISSKSWMWYAAWAPRYFRKLKQAQVLEYHLFRSVFLRLNRSLLTPAFDYARYSASIVDETIIVFFDVEWASWLLAVIILFVTLPISTDGVDGSAQVSALGAFLFGVVVLVLEVITSEYTSYAYRTVMARMGVVGGFDGIGEVLQELWVEPVHYFGMETAAIDVKDLLAAAPVKAPTRQELISTIMDSNHNISRAQANFKARRGSSAMSLSSRRGSTDTLQSMNDSATSTSNGTSSVYATATASGPASNSVSSSKPPCSDEGPDCTDPLYLPPGRVQECNMGGDPFVLWALRPAAILVDRFPGLFKGLIVKVGSFEWFRALFGTCTLLKCYYCAFYFSYAIGCATESSTGTAIMWVVLTPVPILLCLIPLAKRTLPYYTQLACLQGQIVWELVSDIEEQQEMAEEARVKVLSKLQETLVEKTRQCNSLPRAGAYGKDGEVAPSPRSRAINEWFAEWDKDENGTISRGELEKGLQELGIFLSEAQVKELFRLADPDHSKSIDLNEFKMFLSDLQSLETEPERFRCELASRLERSARSIKARSVGNDEFGLLCAAFHPLGAEGLEGDSGRSEGPRRPVFTSQIEGSTTNNAACEQSLAQMVEEGVDAEIGKSSGGVNVATAVSFASRRRPEFSMVHPAPVDDSVEGSRAQVEMKTGEV